MLRLDQISDLCVAVDGVSLARARKAYVAASDGTGLVLVGERAPLLQRTNLAVDPRGTALPALSNHDVRFDQSRYGNNGSYSLVTNAADGPLPELTTYVRFTQTSETVTTYGFHLTGNPETGTFGTEYGFPVTPGERIALSVFLRVTGDPAPVGRLRVRFGDDTINWRPGGVATEIVSMVDGGWARIGNTFTVPAGATRFAAYLVNQSGTNGPGTVMDATGLLLEREATVQSFFSGATTGEELDVYEWSGEVDASASTFAHDLWRPIS
ncbi:hypothetical protein [Homoserinibacter sp. GY 40078]|uniref:hypothetical protein n=1 Tax=Homoserinibacter sp. GY 40078 TaxID=2603275 RepID=UPI0011C78806|nr:hypothetical protein [Homoserinibacter sp. GY 40078]TXK17417.1 hypothetical protein FVQ89_11330 [Homoserinibacter sp. GY 40078]